MRFDDCVEVLPEDFQTQLLSEDAFLKHRIPLPLMSLICQDRRAREKESERKIYIWKIGEAHTYTSEEAETAYVEKVFGQTWCREGLHASWRDKTKHHK